MSSATAPPPTAAAVAPARLCPYPGCGHDAVAAKAAACPRCGRRVKRCEECQALNRRFTRYCQSCGHWLAEASGQWSQYQGGPDRRGLHGHKLDFRFAELELEPVWRYRLQGSCRSLLFYEGLLLVAAEEGDAIAFEVPSWKVFREWRAAPEVVHSGACAGGLLWTPAAERITVLPLVSLEAGADPQVVYSDKLPGRIVHAPLAVGASVFLVVEEAAGRSSLVALRATATGQGLRLSPPEILHRGQRFSAPVTSSADAGTVYFLDETAGGLRLYAVRREEGRLTAIPQPVVDAPSGLMPEIPPASIGHLLYAVFEERHRLCRIDLKASRWEGEMASDVRSFALAGKQDGAVLQSTSLQLLSRKNEEPVLDPMAGPPLVWRELAVVLGLGDGRVRLHSWENLPRAMEVRVSQNAFAAVSALAAFEELLAVGTEDGVLAVYRLQHLEKA